MYPFSLTPSLPLRAYVLYGWSPIKRNLLKFENKDWYKPIRVGNFYSNNYIEFEGNGDRNQNLLIEEHLNKIKLYRKDITIDLQKSSPWKIQLTIVIKFISSKDTDEEQIMYSKSES